MSGTVISSLDGTAVGRAAVELHAAEGVGAEGVTDEQGRFRLQVAEGSYWLLISQFGYGTQRIEDILVVAGETVALPVSLVPNALILNPIVVSSSRQAQPALEAPTATSVVREEDIASRVALSTAHHAMSVPGVDAAQSGMMRTSLVTRGFNDPFSVSLLLLTDNRYAALPSTRLNAFYMVPTTDLDIDRIEVSLGPASALYGPNATNGVLHMITKSPIDDPGSTVSFAGGERSAIQGMFRTAWADEDRKFGVKFSGQYISGDDWTWIDPAEVAAAEADPTNARIGATDFHSERWSGEARLDYRPDDDSELSGSFGATRIEKQTEVSAAGRSIVDGWTYSYAQLRFRKDNLFAQVFGNFSDSGDSYFLRTGLPAVDNSRAFVAQIQHGADIGDRSHLTYGVDFQRSDTRTGGTITGRYEDDDTVDEIGAYVQDVSDITDHVQFVGALRFDSHNRLEDPVWSPRLGLVVTPTDGHVFRATFNRAFRTPAVLDLFLDLVSGSIPIAPGFGYDIRAVGASENGYTFDECPGGVNNACMRVPGVEGQLPADATLLWDQFIAALAPGLESFLPNPGSQVSSVLRRLSLAGGDPFPLDPVGARQIDPLRPRIDNTYELGYKGLIDDRLLLSTSVYYQQIKDFVGPITVETPNVFLDPASTAAYVNAQLEPLVSGGQLTQGDVDALVGGLASIPFGTVTPSVWDAADILLTYRNLGDVNLWGFEVGAEYIASPTLTFGGSLSHVSEDCFDLDEDGACFSPEDRALNSPKWKGQVMGRYHDESSGLLGEARARLIGGFPQAAGVFVGDVDSYSLVDLTVGYRFQRFPNATLTLTASNVFDDRHFPMIGAAEIGRLVMLRLRYDF
ncbi:MAG: TonB-dependent receptor [Gemmatimonadota bacterium]|nr:TonB-dependent receptor [Gemmatimonadota bacterium]